MITSYLNLQANHHIITNLISISGRPHTRRSNYHQPIIVRTPLLNHKRRRHRFKVTGSLSSSSSDNRSGGAVVQQRPPDVGEDMATAAEVGRREKIGEELGIEYLVREYGWKVRRMVEEKSEIREVALIQAHAFHLPSLFFDDFFFHFFQAEVLSGLLYRLRNSPPDRYACLVAEPSKEEEEEVSTKSQPKQQLVGVVDVTVLRDTDVLQHLQGADEYLYVSGIAVSSNYRRQKVATVLLKACEVISVLWGYEYLVLRAYEDDWGARTLYDNAGYRLVSRDPPWVSWIGRRRRILMIKPLR